MDRFAQLMGGVMVVLAFYVAVAAAPPLGEALIRTVAPTRLDALSIVTIVGGTVGGYITFAGAHRLLDAGIVGKGPSARRPAPPFWASGSPASCGWCCSSRPSAW